MAAAIVGAGCVTAAPEIWPPAAGETVRTVMISVDTWHAMIAFPLDAGTPGGGSAAEARALYEEWGYAERAWYLEGSQGLAGAIRALLWPSAAVVEVTVSERIWADRTPQPPAEVFVLRLGEEGYRRLRHYLRRTLASPEPVAVMGSSRFYPARRSYHLFHHCHHYAAKALSEAGLPISAALAASRSSFTQQLRALAGGAAKGGTLQETPVD
jgi:hypothetical protein